MQGIMVSILLTLCLFTVQKSYAQFDKTQLSFLDSLATQDVPPKAPGIATAIIENGKVAYKKVAGYASFADSSLITADTRFNLASNGKQFTALTLLWLEERGKLKLSDDVRLYLPALFSGIQTKITLIHLLTHTSGIRDVYDLWSLQGLTWWEQSFGNGDALAMLEKQEDLNFLPGTDYLYSNSNYILLALVAEKASGRSFVELSSELFRELGMTSTSFVNDYRHIKGPTARAYFNFDTWTTYNWIWNVHGDGNIFSTLNDQIQWEKLVQGQGETSISKALILRSQQLAEPAYTRQYGYGVEFGRYKGLPYRFHEGATGAWKANFLRFPEKRLSIITLTNTGKSIPAMQSRQMADLVLQLPAGSENFRTSPAITGNYLTEDAVRGIYLTADDYAFEFVQEKEKFLLRRFGRNDVELERAGPNIFRQKYDTAFIQEFVRLPNGNMEVTVYYRTHAPYSLRKVKLNQEEMDGEAWEGTYQNPETGVQLVITHQKDNRFKLLLPNNVIENAVLVSATKLLAGNFILTRSPVAGFRKQVFLSSGRIKNIKFVDEASRSY